MLTMPENMRFADVFIGYPIDTTFTYAIPLHMNVPSGVRVRVDFNNRIVTAFVHRVHSQRPEHKTLKEIISVIDKSPIFDSRLIELSKDISSNYICSVGEVLAMALPSGQKLSSRYEDRLIQSGEKCIELTEEQKTIYDDIINSYEGKNYFHLIFGITGSGKTELYIELANKIIRDGRSAIYLVPEIALSSQIAERLYSAFGDELIVYHSHLSQNQRLNNWIRFYNGNARIALGTRSAIFLQCPDLGLIIIDEEHDGSYKEHSTPRYHARRVAYYRSITENTILVMGSATPSIETLYAAEKNILKLHKLRTRYGDAILPKIDIVKISPKKGSGMLSSKLMLHSKRSLDRGEQIIYLLNRRGFSPLVLCNNCSAVLDCPHCNISMNYHNSGKMLCHYCGYSRIFPERCPDCGSEEMIKLGTGTQKIEDIINNVFTNSRVFRLDQDSSRRKNTVYDLINKMRQGEIDILLGTQMVAKGFDFLNVSVVGVLLADIGLNLPDFRSSEKIFSLLTQVAGRCGRGNTPGRVIIQTIDEKNSIFNYLRNHDYLGFYRHELSMRRMLNYPPFSRIARLLVRGKREPRVVEMINALKAELEHSIDVCNGAIDILGPSSAPLSKIGNNYRYHIILKSKNMEELKKIIRATKNVVTGKGVYLEIDIDPYDIL